MAAKRRKKPKSRRAPAKKGGSKRTKSRKPGSRKGASRKAGKAQSKLSPPYVRSRAAGLPAVPPGFVGAIVDSLIRNDGARDIDVRGRDDGNFDVTRLR